MLFLHAVPGNASSRQPCPLPLRLTVRLRMNPLMIILMSAGKNRNKPSALLPVDFGRTKAYNTWRTMEKKEAYSWALKQVRAQIKRHVDITATLANTSAILKSRFPEYFWIGFYMLRGEKLIMGPFQGPPACMQLSLDRGVCAEAVKTGQTVLVPDVDKYSGHVACDSRSRSEIVVPLFNLKDQLVGVLDVDSASLDTFDQEDRTGLEQITTELSRIL